MLLPTVVFTVALSPVPQSPAPTQTPPPPLATSEAAPAAKAAAPSGAAQGAIEAGLAAFKKRRFAAAEVEFRKAVEADPRSAAAAFYLGYTYYKMAEPKRPFHPDKQKAASLFAKAYELDPQFKPVWYTRR